MIALLDKTIFTEIDNNITEPIKYRKTATKPRVKDSIIFVDLKIPQENIVLEKLTQIMTEERAKKRAHFIRGHWCESRKLGSDNCLHDWNYLLDGNHALCKLCGRKTWRRKPHKRGDESLGIIRRITNVVHDGYNIS